MNKTVAIIWSYLHKDWVLIILVCILAIPAFKTLFFIGYFPHHDDLQVMRIFEMEKCFADGQIPCRWVPDMGFGYGYPLFNFYPPFPSLLGVLVRFLTHIQIINVVKVSYILQILTGAVLMYLFAKQWWGKAGGVVSSLFFTYAPYHSTDLYVRAALNEAWAMAFAPGVGWAMTRLYRRITFNNMVLMGVMYSGMLLNHNPMVLIFTPLFVLFGLWLVIVKRSVKLLLSFVGGSFIAALLSAFFTFPVLFEQKYAHVDTIFNGYFNYTQHFVSLYQMFISRFWGYGGSVYGPYDGMAFPIGWIHWIGIVFVMLFALWFLFKRRYTTFGIVAIFVFYFWFSAFAMHQKSSPYVWDHLKLLQEIQFPWRFLSPNVFSSSFVIGALFVLPHTKLTKGVLLVGLAIAVFLVNIEFFHIEYPIHITDQDKLSGKLWQAQQNAGIFDYLPIYAVLPPGRPSLGPYQVLAGNPSVGNVATGSDWIMLNYSADTPVIFRLNMFDFPIFRVTVDGKEVPFDHNNYLGLITLKAPAGGHQIVAKLTNTPIRTVSNVVSLLTILGLAGWFAYMSLRARRVWQSGRDVG